MLNASSPMSRTLHRIGAAICLIAVLAAGGGHWAVLQLFAWACMIVDYSAQNSLADAVEMTFDGKHPCPMCLKIAKARKQERRQPMTVELRKLELFCETRARQEWAFAWSRDVETPFLSDLHPDFIESPPRPPPRFG